MKKLLIIVLIFAFFPLLGCEKKQEFTNTIYAFDTYINISLYEGTEANLKDVEDIYNRVHKLSNSFSTYPDLVNIAYINFNIKEDSETNFTISEDLYNILKIAKDIEEIKLEYEPLTAYWKGIINKEYAIDQTKVESILTSLNSSDNSYTLANSDNTYTLAVKGIYKFDLGCIAKGYATSLVLKYLNENNISKYLIDAGQSTILLGTKANGSGFNVGIISSNEVLKDISNTSIGTASVLERYIEIDNVRYHHIIDTTTGYPTNTFDTVCVIGADPTLADILSTALMINSDKANTYLNTYHLSKIMFLKDGIVVKVVE